MPTRRTYSLLLIALLLYLAANQTQVAWLYILAALIIAVLFASWLGGRGMLHGLRAERRILAAGGEQAATGANAAELHEGTELEVLLMLRNSGKSGALHLLAQECAPATPEDSPWRNARLFIGALAGGAAQPFTYRFAADRRGLHTWPQLPIETAAPFGLFQRRRTLEAPARILVYPEVRPLDKLDLLDRRPYPGAYRQRIGMGAEVIGVRPYRPGDSPRHIHWRSVARTRQLVSKEFADDTDTNLTLAIDLFAHPYPADGSKYTPFEWAVKAAASIGDYARRRGYTLRLLADDTVWPIPSGPLEWYALLHYLARIQPTGLRPINDLLNTRPPDCMAVVLPWPDARIIPAMTAQRARGADLLAVVCDPAAFPAGGPTAEGFAQELRAAGIDVWMVHP